MKHINLCVSGQLYDPANEALNNPLGPGYSSESDQVDLVGTNQAQHPRHALNHGQVMYYSQVMYPGQAMQISPVLNPCQVMNNGEAVEPVSSQVSTLATRQESSMRMADQSQFLNAHNLLGHQKCRSNDKIITDSSNTKRTMIKMEQQERQCDAIDDVFITDCIFPRKGKFKVKNSREAQSKESYMEERDKQSLETQDHSSVLKEPQQYTTLDDQHPYSLMEAQEQSTTVEAQKQCTITQDGGTYTEEQDKCPAMDNQHQHGNRKTDVGMEIMTEKDTEVVADTSSPSKACGIA